MIKTIKAGDETITLNNSIGWTMEYRDQFGEDIIPVLMPILASAMDIIPDVIKKAGKTEEISLDDILEVLDGDALIDALGHLGAFEFNDVLHIIWAMAKNADEGIPEPKAWIKQFDEFPLDEILPEVVKLIFRGVVSSKNLKRLSDLKKKAQKKTTSTSTQSFLQPLSAGSH